MPLAPRRVLKTFRYAMYFDGVGSRVIKSSPSGFTSYEYTIVAWLMFAQLGSEAGYPRTWFITNAWWGPILSELSPVNRLLLRFGTSVSRIDIFSNYLFDKNWHNVALVAKSGGYGSIYIDGKLDRRITTSQTFDPADIIVIRLGHLYAGSVFQGFISQVLIYSRTLSDSEILWNYQYPDNPVRNGLVLWLQASPENVGDIDNDGILEWIDLSGYNNHGKIYGAQLVELVKAPARVLSPARVLYPVR